MNKISKQMYFLPLIAFFLFSFVFATGESVPKETSLPTSTSTSGVALPASSLSPLSGLADSQTVLKSNYITYIKFSFCEDKVGDK